MNPPTREAGVLILTSPLAGEVAAQRRVGGRANPARIAASHPLLSAPPPGGEAPPTSPSSGEVREKTRAGHSILTSPLEGEVAAQRRVEGNVAPPVSLPPPPGGEAPPTSPARGEVKRLHLGLVALALLFSASPAVASSPADALAAAESAFAEGVELRTDSAKARPAFARAAAAYDVLWNRGHHTPELALNRARAHRLAGSLPRSVAALHDGLAVARFARPLQVELDDARAAVPFPLDGELAVQCRPRAVGTVSARMSPADAWFAAGFLWLLACTGAARFAMTRSAVWLGAAAAGVAGLLLLGGLWVEDARRRARDESLPLLVAADDVMLRKGNADAYPPRVEPALPKGTEVREVSRRGGWVQVRLPGGATGWLPEAAVIACGG